jgi:hypothetical protein
MAMLMVVVGEELAAEDIGVFDGPKSARKCRAVLECFVVNMNAGGGEAMALR